jgi:hypothetical protein
MQSTKPKAQVSKHHVPWRGRHLSATKLRIERLARIDGNRRGLAGRRWAGHARWDVPFRCFKGVSSKHTDGSSYRCGYRPFANLAPYQAARHSAHEAISQAFLGCVESFAETGLTSYSLRLRPLRLIVPPLWACPTLLRSRVETII